MNQRKTALLNALNSIFLKSSFKINGEESYGFQALEDTTVLEKVIEYAKNFPESTAHDILQYLIAVTGAPIDTHIENNHPLLAVMLGNIRAIAGIDPYFIDDSDIELPKFEGFEGAAEELTGVTEMAANHPLIVALKAIYAKAHVLSPQVSSILIQVGEAIQAGDGIAEELLLTTKTEVLEAAKDGGFSKPEVDTILDNLIDTHTDPDLFVEGDQAPTPGIEDEIPLATLIEEATILKAQEEDAEQELDEVKGDAPAEAKKEVVEVKTEEAKPAAKPAPKTTANRPKPVKGK